MKTQHIRLLEAGGLTAASIALVAAAIAAPTMAESDYSMEVEDLLPAIAQTEAPEQIPDWLSESDLDPATIRKAGESSYGTHWIATDRGGNICIATQLGDEDSGANWVGSISCLPPPLFYKYGAYIESDGQDVDGAFTLLLPPDVDASALEDDGAFEVLTTDPQPVIATSVTNAARLRSQPLQHADGTPIELHP